MTMLRYLVGARLRGQLFQPIYVIERFARRQCVGINAIKRGAQRIDQTTVLSYLPIRPGDTVDAAVLDVAVRTLSRTGLFADVQLGVQNGDLIVQIVENPIINQVVFEGNSAVSGL